MDPTAAPPPALRLWSALLAEAQAPQSLAHKLLGAALAVLIAALVCLVLSRVVRRLRPVLTRHVAAAPDTTGGRARGALTALSLVGSLLRWLVILTAALYVLASFGVNLVPVLTGVGFLGAAIAFGAQALVRDLVTGLFILLEGQYAVGEWVSLNGVLGRVAEVGLRTTALDLPDGRRQYFPNGAISTVAVYPRPQLWYELQVPLAAAAPAQELLAPLAELAQELQAVYPERLVEVRPPRLAPGERYAAGLTLAVAVAPGYEWVATEELVSRVKGLLAAREITLPAEILPQARPLPGAPAASPEGAD